MKSTVWIFLGVVILASCNSWVKEDSVKRGSYGIYFAAAHSKGIYYGVGNGGVADYWDPAQSEWIKRQSPTGCLYGFDMLDEDTLVACGNGRGVSRSEDGGRTWIRMTDYGNIEPEHCRYVSFADTNNGWIASPYQIGETTDGGVSWREIRIDERITFIMNVFQTGAGTGYILDNDGTFYFTNDGGLSWTDKGSLPIKQDILIDLTEMVQTTDFRFDGSGGTAAVLSQKGERFFLTVYRSATGNRVWRKESVRPVKKGSLSFSPDGKRISLRQDRNGILVVFRKL